MYIEYEDEKYDLRCCYLGCNKKARFVIGLFTMDYIHSCREHVYDLFSDESTNTVHMIHYTKDRSFPIL